MDVYLAPDPAPHTGYCSAFAWRWRMEHPARADDVKQWPCRCNPPTPWTLVERPHPTWCHVPGEHPWTECTVSLAKE